MIGPETATVKLRGIKSPMYALVVPMRLVKQLEQKTGEKLEDRDQVRIWIEKTGIKSDARPWAFKKKVENLEQETPIETDSE